MALSINDRFKANVEDLLYLSHELICKLVDNGISTINPALVNMGENFISNYDSNVLIREFIDHSNMYWTDIKSRNEKFFIENAGEIFASDKMPNLKINAFKDIFASKYNNGEYIIDEDDRKSIWIFMDSIVKLSIKYIHQTRSPRLVKRDGKIIQCYRNNYASDIKLKKVSRHWGVKLEWITSS